MPEASYLQAGDAISFTTVGALSAGEVIQVPDGRAAVAITDYIAGAIAVGSVSGIHRMSKTANQIYVPGQRMYWDASESKVTAIPPITAADYFVGCCVTDAAAADTEVEVDLNNDWEGSIDQRTSTFAQLPVAAAGNPRSARLGGGERFSITATSEAQKIDALSHKAVALASDWIFCAEVTIDAAAGSATDISIGMADGTDATDFQSVGAFCTIHVDGGSQNILVQSDDPDVAPVDSNIDWVAAVPFSVVIDGRDTADIKLYINGIRETATSTTLAIETAASGLKAVVHIEKTTGTNVATVTVSNLKVLTADL